MNDKNEQKKLEEEFLRAFSKVYEKVSKEINDGNGSNSNHLDKMKSSMRSILESLIKNKDHFNIENTKVEFELYIGKYKRILYSEVTVFVFALDNNLPVFMTNIESVVEHYIENDSEIKNETTKAFIKLWDHVNLANNQIDKLRLNEEKFAKQTEPILESVKITKKGIEDTTKELENTKKEIITQLISIVGIFTALAFVGFGGISMLNTIFGMDNNKGILIIIVLGSLCGIVIMNIIFIFIYFVSKMSNMSIKTCGHAGICQCSVLTKYPFFYISNAIMLEIFFVSSVLYVSRSQDVLLSWIKELAWLFIIVITVLIIGFICFTINACLKTKKDSLKQSATPSE